MKKLSKAAAIAFVLSLAFLLPVGCKTNPTGETSSEENSSSESVPDVDSSVQTPDETPTLPDDTPEPPDDTPQPEPEPEPPAKSYASYIKCTRDGVNIRADGISRTRIGGKGHCLRGGRQDGQLVQDLL